MKDSEIENIYRIIGNKKKARDWLDIACHLKLAIAEYYDNSVEDNPYGHFIVQDLEKNLRSVKWRITEIADLNVSEEKLLDDVMDTCPIIVKNGY